ncbi:MAG: hypothetical protein ACXW3D_01020 [Caulobacteraceae bacterium]
MKIALLALALSMTTVAAFAEDATIDPNRLICKATANTGSRLPVRKTCLTKQEWDERTAETRKLQEDWLNHARTGNCIPKYDQNGQFSGCTGGN